MMMTSTLSRSDKEKAQTTLEQLVSLTRDMDCAEDLHKKASEILGGAFEGKPELIKRAAEAYNSNKSIYYLSRGTDDTRAESFALLDPQRLYNDAVKNTTVSVVAKAASGVWEPVFGRDEEPIHKASSSEASSSEASPTPYVSYRDRGYEDSFSERFTDEFNRASKVIHTLRNQHCMLKRAAAHSADLFCMSFHNMKKDQQASAAALLRGKFGSHVDSLFNEYKAFNPMFKAASISYKGTPLLPKGDLYTQATDYVIAKFAAAQVADTLSNFCCDIVQMVKGLPGKIVLYSKSARLKKEAGVVGALTVTTAMNKMWPEATGIDEDSKDKVLQDLHTPALENVLRELEAKRALYEVLSSDDFISSYPVDEIVKAYNDSLQMLPPQERIHPSRNLRLVRSWVAEQLGRGGMPSASDAQKVLEAQRVFQTSKCSDKDGKEVAV